MFGAELLQIVGVKVEESEESKSEQPAQPGKPE